MNGFIHAPESGEFEFIDREGRSKQLDENGVFVQDGEIKHYDLGDGIGYTYTDGYYFPSNGGAPWHLKWNSETFTYEPINEIADDDVKILAHYGIKGQQWGDRNGPPYPLKRSEHTLVQEGHSAVEEYFAALSRGRSSRNQSRNEQNDNRNSFQNQNNNRSDQNKQNSSTSNSLSDYQRMVQNAGTNMPTVGGKVKLSDFGIKSDNQQQQQNQGNNYRNDQYNKGNKNNQNESRTNEGVGKGLSQIEGVSDIAINSLKTINDKHKAELGKYKSDEALALVNPPLLVEVDADSINAGTTSSALSFDVTDYATGQTHKYMVNIARTNSKTGDAIPGLKADPDGPIEDPTTGKRYALPKYIKRDHEGDPIDEYGNKLNWKKTAIYVPDKKDKQGNVTVPAHYEQRTEKYTITDKDGRKTWTAASLARANIGRKNPLPTSLIGQPYKASDVKDFQELKQTKNKSAEIPLKNWWNRVIVDYQRLGYDTSNEQSLANFIQFHGGSYAKQLLNVDDSTKKMDEVIDALQGVKSIGTSMESFLKVFNKGN